MNERTLSSRPSVTPTVPFKSADPVASSISLAQLLSALSLVLLVVFGVSVITPALPPQPLDPQWQLALVAALVNNGSVALVGALLTPLGYAFDTSNDRLRQQRVLVRRWSLAAGLGFLLLIPLQISGSFGYFRSVTNNLESQTKQSASKLSAVRQAIASAPDQRELQARMLKLLGTGAVLSPTQLRMTLPELRQQLLAQTEQAATLLRQRIEAQNQIKPDRLVRESLRVTLLALAYAVGFAFLAGMLPREWKRQGSRRAAAG